jgi:predicted transcriptional regulator
MISADSKKYYAPPFWVKEVKSHMKHKGVSQEFIASKLGIARSAVGHYFSGKNALPLSSVDTFCEYIDLDRSVFFDATRTKAQVMESSEKEYIDDETLSTNALKVINNLKALDKSGKLTKEIANSIITLLKAFK